ncbi:MAG: arginine--tRNA ligase [Chloroflexi bacterium]|nr:arginine--tRNA ligase [Chloroflexota bacterium]
MTLKKRIAEILRQGLAEAQQRGTLPAMALPEVIVEHPQKAEHGDYATSLPLRLARGMGMNPLAIAERIAAALPPSPEIGKVEVAAPGFINISINPAWLAQQVQTVRKQGDRFGDSDLGKGKRVQLEFVSVNPTGPLHVGHGRGAVLGSALANVLSAAGFAVAREYYLNDAGNQMENFFRSLYVRYLQAQGRPAEMPAEGYMGTYMVELAREIVREFGDRFLTLPQDEAVRQIGQIGMVRIVEALKRDLKALGVEFDIWFSEKSLFEGGQYEKATALLRQGGYLEQREGALWFTSTALGESKDNVIVRSTGAPTYFASDIAYHYNKFLERNFDEVINIWGADHQGHVSRMKAAVAALGVEPQRLKIIISQMVTLKRGEEVVRVSKRSGELITLREVMDEVGADACRFFFLSRSADAQMDFDLELAKKQSQDNPVYYVQYAHARIASILSKARERGYTWDDSSDTSALLTSPHEIALIRKMLELSEVIETVSTSLEAHHLPYYATELATIFHLFYKHCRVMLPNRPLSAARLKLVEAAKAVLARSLHLMGMTAPEKM